MLEIVVFAGLFAALAAFAWVPWIVLIQIAGLCSVVGLAIGVPGALVYHVRLRLCLIRSGDLPARWWVHPFAHHGRLAAADLDWVLPPCWIGASGGVVAFLGCLIGAVAVVSAWVHG
ncbi:MAG: hypothetical protein JRH01_18040 [Deltaproteobacteria bacterium]|nr:hypothetical protein [Deltaproteobacteria bacterium]MBW2394407.1 hypothetical protein [Deltaproteobacteria bacterium]